jgi:hypothetical protein
MAEAQNVYQHMTETTCSMLVDQQISSLSTHSGAQKLASDTSNKLTERNTSDEIAKQNDDESWTICSDEYEEWMELAASGEDVSATGPHAELYWSVQEQFQLVFGYSSTTVITPSTPATQKGNGTADGQTGLADVNSPEAMNDYMNQFSNSNYLCGMSSAFMSTIMGVQSEYYGDDDNAQQASANQSTLNSIAGVVSENAQADNQLLTNDVSVETNLNQQITSSTSTIMNCCDSLLKAQQTGIAAMGKM